MDYTHGNYCGWTWSNGKFQDSVCGDKPPTDAFDRTCKRHDCCLFKAGNDRVSQGSCNKRFFRDNFGQGFVRTNAAIAVRNFQPPLRFVSDKMSGAGPSVKQVPDSWDISKRGPFDFKKYSESPWWQYEDIKGSCRNKMESRWARPSHQKQKRKYTTNFSAERSVKRRIERQDINPRPKSKARRALFKDPVARQRAAFAQLPREWRVAHANYLRARYRLRKGVWKRERLRKARTLSGMFARGRASNRIKRWYKYQKRRWRHYPIGGLVHANQSRIDRYNLRRRHAKFQGKYRRQYLVPYKW